MTITDKLLKIQCELKAPKNQFNSFGKYKYRSLEDITEAVKPLLLVSKCALLINDEIVEVGGRVYVKATATLISGDEKIAATAFAREPENKKGMDEAQITGSASSYARKYCLNGLFAIDDTKDADGYNNRDDNKSSQRSPSLYNPEHSDNIGSRASPKITTKQLKVLQDAIQQHDVDLPRFYSYYKIEHLHQMQTDKFEDALKLVYSKPPKTIAIKEVVAEEQDNAVDVGLDDKQPPPSESKEKIQKTLDKWKAEGKE